MLKQESAHQILSREHGTGSEGEKLIDNPIIDMATSRPVFNMNREIAFTKSWRLTINSLGSHLHFPILYSKPQYQKPANVRTPSDDQRCSTLCLSPSFSPVIRDRPDLSIRLPDWPEPLFLSPVSCHPSPPCAESPDANCAYNAVNFLKAQKNFE